MINSLLHRYYAIGNWFLDRPAPVRPEELLNKGTIPRSFEVDDHFWAPIFDQTVTADTVFVASSDGKWVAMISESEVLVTELARIGEPNRGIARWIPYDNCKPSPNGKPVFIDGKLAIFRSDGVYHLLYPTEHSFEPEMMVLKLEGILYDQRLHRAQYGHVLGKENRFFAYRLDNDVLSVWEWNKIGVSGEFTFNEVKAIDGIHEKDGVLFWRTDTHAYVMALEAVFKKSSPREGSYNIRCLDWSVPVKQIVIPSIVREWEWRGNLVVSPDRRYVCTYINGKVNVLPGSLLIKVEINPVPGANGAGAVMEMVEEVESMSLTSVGLQVFFKEKLKFYDTTKKAFEEIPVEAIRGKISEQPLPWIDGFSQRYMGQSLIPGCAGDAMIVEGKHDSGKRFVGAWIPR